MKIATRRWGEITIKKQGKMKNKFEKTTSFSILNSTKSYNISKIKELFMLVIELTDKHSFNELKLKLKKWDN